MDKELQALVIEDAVGDFLLIERHLLQHGLAARCQRVASLQELGAAIEANRWDVVLSDYNVPGLGFREALDLHQAHQPDVPLILVSGSLGEETAVEMLKLGVWDFVLKENLTRLVPAIERALHEASERCARREAERALRESQLAALNMMEDAVQARERAEQAAAELQREMAERQRAEAALRASEERYRGIFDEAVAAIYVFDVDKRFTNANQAGLDLLGYTRDELLSLAIPDVDADPVAVLPAHETLLSGGRLIAYEHRLRRKDGTIITVLNNSRPLTDAQGRVVGMLSTVIDITDRKKAEADRERLATAIEQAAETIVVTDAGGTIQYVNPAFTRVTGYTRAEAVGNNPRLLKSGRHDAGFYCQLWHKLAAGETWQGRFVNRHKDGTLFTEEATISPVRDAAGRIANFVAVKHDISRELHLESQVLQAQKMESVGRLAGGVAHDFNNLLMGIINYIALARDELPADHPVRGCLDEIASSAQRSVDLTRQLLTFARKQPVSPVVLDLNDTLEAMLGLLRRLIGEDIELAWLPGPFLGRTTMDVGQIDQVLTNLCVNARDAMAGPGRIVIETRNATLDAAYCAEHVRVQPGEYVLLTVSDNGCGMDRETLEHIFEPFFTTKEPGRGTGLGLATVYGIVRQNQGAIDVRSEPGKGTTFRVYLPRVASAPGQAPRPEPPSEAPRGVETVLLVEDDRSVRLTCQRCLEKLGYTVLTAGTAAAALALAGRYSGHIHLLLTDVVLPGVSGKELAAQLVAARPGIRCLFMSGYPADIVAHRGVLDQGVAFLSKPFSRETLAGKVREVLAREQDGRGQTPT